MSENLDLVRSIYADWERGDFSHVEWADPEIECVVRRMASRRRHGTGMAGYGGGLARLSGASGVTFASDADEYRELDDERVLVLAQFSGRGKTSGVEVARQDPGEHAFSTSATAR